MNLAEYTDSGQVRQLRFFTKSCTFSTTLSSFKATKNEIYLTANTLFVLLRSQMNLAAHEIHFTAKIKTV